MDNQNYTTTEHSNEQLSEGQFFQITDTHSGIVKQVLSDGQYLVVWIARKPRKTHTTRKTVHHVNTAKRAGIAYLVNQDTLAAALEVR